MPAQELILLLATLLPLAFALQRLWITARNAGWPATTITLLSYGGIIYLAALLPGAVGIFTPVTFSCTMVAVCLTLLMLCVRHNKSVAIAPAPSPGIFSAPWTPLSVGLAFVGCILCADVLRYFLLFPYILSNPHALLAWDAHIYHMDTFIRLIQAKSFWAFDTRGLDMPFGFELISAYPGMIFFHKPWSLIIANLYSALLLLSGMYACVLALLKLFDLEKRVNALVVSLLSWGWFSYLHDYLLFKEAGKNDIFQGACVLAALALLLWALARQKEQKTPRPEAGLLALAGVSYGLAIATKPPSLYYGPFFLFFLLFGLPLSCGQKPTLRDALRNLLLFSVPAAFLGGFIYMRNLYHYGDLANPRLISKSMRSSMAWNLDNKELVHLTLKAVNFYLATLLPTAVLVYFTIRARNAKKRLSLFLLLYHFSGFLAFVLTPYMFHLGPQKASWIYRYTMSYMMFAGIILAIVLVATATWFAEKRRRALHLLFPLSFVALFTCTAGYWQTISPKGMPKFQTFSRLPQTGIDTWIASQKPGMRIYSYGLPPFQLYGPDWANTVAFSNTLCRAHTPAQEQKTIMSMVRRTAPDIVVLSNAQLDCYEDLFSFPAQQAIKALEDSGFLLAYKDQEAMAFVRGKKDGTNETASQ